MSIPRLELPPAGAEFADDSADTALIRQLFSGLLGGGGAPSSAPSDFPRAGKSPASEDTGLTGGYPSSPAAGPPPVHPSALGSYPSSEAERDGHEEEANEFGEPRLEPAVFRHQAAKDKSDASYANAAPPSFPHTGDSAAGYYFLPFAGAADPSFLFPARPSDSTLLLAPSLDVSAVRRDFPALHQRVNGHPLIYLDNAATTHKPQAVLDAVSAFYAKDNSNIHRAAHELSNRATRDFEAAREKVRRFLGAESVKEIVFLRGTTEAINLVANSYGRQHIGQGDEIILSALEHHANIVPWQLLAEQTGAVIRVIPINDAGELILEEYEKLLGPRTKFVSVTHVSNALGTINPVELIIQLAHARGVPVLVDGAQSTPHLPVDVRALDADFYVFSGHKVFGPTGVGALYGKAALLETMPPWQGGGHMIREVSFERTVYQDAPEKFEAGTPNIAGAIGLGAAIDYLHHTGIPAIAAYEHALLEYGAAALSGIRGLRPVGTAATKASVLSFTLPGVSDANVARHLDQRGIAVRAGHHCAQPSLRHFDLATTVRPSLAFYNTFAEIDALVESLHRLTRP